MFLVHTSTLLTLLLKPFFFCITAKMGNEVRVEKKCTAPRIRRITELNRNTSCIVKCKEKQQYRVVAQIF